MQCVPKLSPFGPNENPVPVAFAVEWNSAMLPGVGELSLTGLPALIALEHGFALFNKSLHRLAVIGRHRGADQALRLMVARGRKIDQQGFVEIVLHVAQRDRRPFRYRFCERKGL